MINWHHPINHPVCIHPLPIGSMYAIYGNIYHQYTPNVSIYTIYGSYGLLFIHDLSVFKTPFFCVPKKDAARIAILFDQVRELTSPAEASTRRSVPWGQKRNWPKSFTCGDLGILEVSEVIFILGYPHLWSIYRWIFPNKKPPAIGNPQDFRKRPIFPFAERINEKKWEMFHRSPCLVTAGNCHMCCYRCKNRDF